MQPDERIAAMGLVLPDPIQLPEGVELNFSWLRSSRERAFLSAHLALDPDGSIHDCIGKVGGRFTLEEGYGIARQTGITMLSTLMREWGTLNNISAWLRVFGMVNVAPGFTDIPAVINGFSDLILEVFGSEVGAHARSVCGVAELPFGAAVEIEAEVEIRGM